MTPTPVADHYLPADRSDEIQRTYPLDLYMCTECGHVQLLDVVDPSYLFSEYVYKSSVSLGLLKHFADYADMIMEYVPLSEKSCVLDIGSNDGSFLKELKSRRVKVLGVDPARAIASEATASGIETIPSFFNSVLAREIRNDRGPMHVISANNVFAHSDELSDMAEGIRELLADDGVFVFEVSYLVDIVEKYLFDTVYHEHLCYHTVKPLKVFFSLHGMELIDIQRIPTKGGSIRVIVQLAGGPREVAPIVEELITKEVAEGYDQLSVYQKFAADIQSAKHELLDYLDVLIKQGKVICGFGASATVTTLLYHFELTDKLEFIMDDNPVKQKTFSPGCHIPVLSPSEGFSKNPDHVVLLAWNYWKPITEKYQDFRDKGGGYIVPLPKMKVL